MVYVQHLAIPQHSIRRTGSHRTMTSNVIDDVFNNSVARKALFALHILFNFAAMWFIFRNDLVMQYIYLDTEMSAGSSLTTYVELGVVGALSFWSLCWHRKTLTKICGSDHTILLAFFIIFFITTVAVRAIEGCTIDPIIIVCMPSFEQSISNLPYQFFWQIALIFLKARYEKADTDKVKRDVIVSYRLMFFLYLCYVAACALSFALSLTDKTTTFREYYRMFIIIMVFMVFVLVTLFPIVYLIVNFKRLSARNNLSVSIFAFERGDSDNVCTRASFAELFFYFCSLASLIGLCMLLLTIFIPIFTGIFFWVIVGALTILHYLTTTFKGLCVNSVLASRVFVIVVIVIGLTTKEFLVFLGLPTVAVQAYLLFFVIIFFFLNKKVNTKLHPMSWRLH
ncbi:membrane protein [Candidatus Magnetoovum chiemensis]|nr:membrane protein [Candidatus Magnetoovum chiemensis]